MAEGLKWRVNRAVKRSTLPPPSRLVMFVLSDRADSKTAVIPEEHTPSQTELAEETGLGIATVKRHLDALTAAGWIVREIPNERARARGEKTRYRLAIGGGSPDPSTDQSDTSSTAHSDTSSTDQSDTTSTDQTELVSERAGISVIPELVSERSLSTAQTDTSSYLLDRDDQNDLTTTSADADGEGDGGLFPVADSKAPRKPKADPSERFEEFYKTYPRHIYPGRAEKAWIAAVKAGAEPQVIIEAAERFAALCKRQRTAAKWIPYPSTWLTDRGWQNEDEPQSDESRPGQHRPYLEDPDDDRPYAGEL